MVPGRRSVRVIESRMSEGLGAGDVSVGRRGPSPGRQGAYDDRDPIGLWRLLMPAAVLLVGFGILTPAEASVRSGSLFLLMASVLSMAAIFKVIPRRPLTVGFIYLLLTALFNGGLLFSIAVGHEPNLFDPSHRTWLLTDNTGAAGVIAGLSMAVLTLAYLICYATMRIRTPRGVIERASSPPVGIAACLLLGAGTILWWSEAGVSSGAISDATYSEFNAAAEGSL